MKCFCLCFVCERIQDSLRIISNDCGQRRMLLFAQAQRGYLWVCHWLSFYYLIILLPVWPPPIWYPEVCECLVDRPFIAYDSVSQGIIINCIFLRPIY